ncbi:NAD-dependent succinate-semialdehyde dehydrogenase [Burkholderia stabilis]|uniref:NAD-dependent succinate-semialdehyde dehydrogenase n=1 Tax=Burkholderia stabilis TaxID=95485 RepID=UPI000AA9E64F|nr:NAD-dependent succinate-semialdehyde dehydrogenase [Burkholderia stabilis]HDR9494652.1 NAD-dependent succinate-semialdehyde dehydrogenase [Burkholderia stabilis]HDR9524368.1 NAD-dependent succinate-semialdehyde dehydrogenase [Burkholderia stabilis]HDR9541525.1 NAD-dependent succinate-semialdehyde dehydrogenase [Burkholderia stabilis]HDR9571341.1 NAD-dependent succinate-semialdehyde dehydrogenase [Burkholderia stabilis]HDR9579603.1 NAD-dependent succinate-semialdehyde dehydrogenase [Burkhold
MRNEQTIHHYPDVRLFIGGEWRSASDGGRIPVNDPATGDVIGTVACATRADLEQAVNAAERSLEKWRGVSPVERAEILCEAARLLRTRIDEIAWLLTREQGKPLAQAAAEISASADMTQWLAEEGRRTFGRVIPSRSTNVLQYTTKFPVGPVAAFTPWNFPVNQVARKLAAALAAGCSVIVKAPEETPASPAALIQAFVDAGVPAGVVNLVYGVPEEISEFLIPHPAIAKISFTGSTAVGKHLAALAGQYMKRSTMELGGHAPVLIFDDADIDKAVEVLITTKFRNAGQVCASPTRFLLQEGIAEHFIDKFVTAAQSLQIGSGLDPQVQMGPLANERRAPALEALIDDAVGRGAKLLMGGGRLPGRGNFFPPTVLANLPTTARIMNEEPFGPVVLLNRFRTLDEAIKEANRLPYGLASYAYSRSASTIHAVGTRIVAGMTTINHSGLGLPEVPFGGVRDSGYGEEGGPDAVEPYLVNKFVTVAT